MSKAHRLLRAARSLHLYIGVFIAPAVVFFAFTGALQTFSLHETTQGRDYTPPKWIAVLAQIHKKQTDVVPARKLKAATPDAAADHEPHHDKPRHNAQADPTREASASAQPAQNTAKPPAQPPQETKTHLPLKIFFLLVSLGLFTSTLTGIYMSYKYSRRKLLMTGLLIAGIVLPLALLPF